MTTIARIWACLRSLNTHPVCWAGLFFAFGSLFAIGCAHFWNESWATTHLHGFAGVVHALVDGAATVGLVVIWPAIIAAALGRPPTIASGPKP
jgi:hypothetical protein